MKLTPKQSSALAHVRWACEHFDGASTGGAFTARIARSLEAKGLIEDGGDGVMVDGDGFTIQPERWRRLWKLREDTP
jgi:hypothetical protein